MIRVGIISPSEIAFRRFLPAISKLADINFAGIAVANVMEWEGVTEVILKNEREKADNFVKQYGGKVYDSYQEIIESDDIDALYIPLPPALHYTWAKSALLANKHILVEKPATTSLMETRELISLAREKNLAMHENYMFVFHNQLSVINEIIRKHEIGEVRLFRLSFGFPRRASTDFRYNRKLGGGALLDCGGYAIKYASLLLGDTARIVYAYLNYIDEFDVDIYGSAALINDSGMTVQLSFGMDNSYKCELEVWGSQGALKTDRVFTAPPEFQPELSINYGGGEESRILPSDDTFMKSITRFQKAITDHEIRNNNFDEILRQAHLVDEYVRKVRWNHNEA
jgi:dTDP-3,4-didehydro-2,6-dideoxy-alpha-D-glucose 3-reductase